MVITDGTKNAVCMEVVRIVDGLFLEIAEAEQDHATDEFVDELWTLFAAGELRLIDGRMEPVYGEEGHHIAAKENGPIVEARAAVLTAAGAGP